VELYGLICGIVWVNMWNCMGQYVELYGLICGIVWVNMWNSMG